jgi:ubiquitin carboxyl-terminal hydrolase 14
MPTLTVAVKWSGKSFDVPVDTSAGVPSFKRKLEEFTGVPPERQKVMSAKHFKGVLKDDVDLGACGLADGAVITLMGDAKQVAVAAAATVRPLADGAPGPFPPARRTRARRLSPSTLLSHDRTRAPPPIPPSGIAQVFVEDLPVARQQALGSVLPSGLENEGNTCYANSVVEVCRSRQRASADTGGGPAGCPQSHPAPS